MRSRRVLVSFRIVVMMLGIVRVTVFMRGHSIVVVRGLSVTSPGVVVTSAGAETLHVAQPGAHDPDDNAQRRPCADSRADFRLSRSVCLQSITSSGTT